MRVPECHPDRTHYARGMCGKCYYQARRNEGYKPPLNHRASDCHPDRPNVSKGRCGACYRRDIRAADPEKYRKYHRERQRRARQQNPELINRKAQAKRYGLTLAERDALFDSFNNQCAVCQSDHNLHIDHCHETGAVRGVLCGPCNSALGHARDSVTRLKELIAYLERSFGLSEGGALDCKPEALAECQPILPR